MGFSNCSKTEIRNQFFHSTDLCKSKRSRIVRSTKYNVPCLRQAGKKQGPSYLPLRLSAFARRKRIIPPAPFSRGSLPNSVLAPWLRKAGKRQEARAKERLDFFASLREEKEEKARGRIVRSTKYREARNLPAAAGRLVVF